MGNNTWEAYYKQAFEREKQKNNVLAGELSDAERKREELAAKYQRIVGNPLYRAAKPFRLAGKAGKKIIGLLQRSQDGKADLTVLPKEDVLVADYRQRLRRQKYPYDRWIEETEAGMRLAWQAAVKEGQQLRRQYVILTAQQGELEEEALDWCLLRMKEQGLLMAYTHEDFRLPSGRRLCPWMKPLWQPDTFLSCFCLGSLVILERGFAKSLGWEEACAGNVVNIENAAFLQSRGNVTDLKSRRGLYELCLRGVEALAALGKTPALLDAVAFHRSFPMRSGEDEEAAERRLLAELAAGEHIWGYEEAYNQVKEAACRRQGRQGSMQATKEPGVYAWVPGARPFVSIIIPSKDHPDVLERCVRSIREKTDYPAYEILVVDNGSAPENREELERITKAYELRYFRQEMDFNFSRMCNLGAAQAKGDCLLLLNNDMEVIEENWLSVLAGQAMEPGTGAVGAKLYYPGGERLQHAGITDMGIGPSHKLATFSDESWYYFGVNRFTMDCIGVTAACLCVKKTLYDRLGGLAESMPVAYNDVDFNFRLWEAGYYNVLRNDAVLYHHESLTRGLDEQTEEKWNRLLQEKERLYQNRPAGRDPFYSPYLIQDAPEYVLQDGSNAANYLYTVGPVSFDWTGKELLKAANSRLRVTVDRTMRQLKIHKSEPEIYLIDGWSYVQGADNCRFDRWLRLCLEPAPDAPSKQAEDAVAVPGGEGAGRLGGPAEKKEGRILYFTAEEKYRPDVEAILPAERNIGLAGFVVRILRKDLQPGVYRISLVCRDKKNGQLLYGETDRTLTVRESGCGGS